MNRDWTIAIAGFGLFLVSVVSTLCALFGVMICVNFMITDWHIGYLLGTLATFGIACVLGAAAHFFFTQMVKS